MASQLQVAAAASAAAVQALWRGGGCSPELLRRSGRLLSVGLLIQRKAVLTPEPSELERQVSALFATLDLERSRLCDFELRDRAETQAAKRSLRAAAEGLVQVAKDGTVITAKDLMERWAAERQAVTLGSRDADPSLMRPALLVSSDPDLSIPCCPVTESDASLRSACDRLLAAMGLAGRCRLLGNAPAGLHAYKYRKSPVSLFLYRALYTGEDWGAAVAAGGDWLWAGADNLRDRVPDPRLLRKLQLLAAEY